MRNTDRGRKSPVGRVRAKMPLAYYRSAQPNTAQSPFKEKKGNSVLRKAFVRSIDIVLLGLLMVGLVYSLMVRPQSKILASSYYHQKSEYKTLADTELKKPVNRNKITLDQQSIAEALKNKFPEVDSANVELPLFSQIPTIHLLISQPAFFLIRPEAKYIVSTQGTVIGTQSQFKNTIGLAEVKDETGFPVKVGSQVLSSSAAGFIDQLIRESKAAEVPIKSLTLPAKAQEMNLYTLDRSYFVKFQLNSDANQQIGQFLAARHQFDQSSSQPAEYLDVRVPGKVFYK